MKISARSVRWSVGVLALAASGFVVVALASAGTTSAPGSADRASQVIRFSGNGGKTLSPFRATRPSTMYWTNSGSIFQIFGGGGGASNASSINSQAHRGTSFVRSGSYRLQVNAIGSWTITIRTGIERIGNPIRFKGNGGKTLPPFTLSRGKTMYWTNTGPIFQTFPSGLTLNGSVNSQAHRGTTHLPAGRYQLFINAQGTWTITIR
jgi:hypothetical protein